MRTILSVKALFFMTLISNSIVAIIRVIVFALCLFLYNGFFGDHGMNHNRCRVSNKFQWQHNDNDMRHHVFIVVSQVTLCITNYL